MWQCYVHVNDFANYIWLQKQVIYSVEALKETFPSNSEEEIAKALENTSSRNEAAEKRLAADSMNQLMAFVGM